MFIIPVGIVIKELRPLVKTQRAMNGIIRTAFKRMAHLWIRRFLPMHFGPSAARRYGYAFRTKRWLARKLRVSRDAVPFIDPRPMEYTGDLKNQLLRKTPEAFNVKATATANRQRVVIPLRYPHPINTKNTGELSALLKSELQVLTDFVIDDIQKQIRELPEEEQTTKVA